MKKLLLTILLAFAASICFSQGGTNYHLFPIVDTIINGNKHFMVYETKRADDGSTETIATPVDSAKYVFRVLRDTRSAALRAKRYHEGYLADYIAEQRGFNNGNLVLQTIMGLSIVTGKHI